MLLGIDEKDWLDSTKINVISGEAGTGKSTQTHNFYESHGMSISWDTSSHQLKRAAEEKFGHKCYTAAAGIAKTVNGKFFAELQKPNTDVVVIDEVLQLNFQRVVDFCNEFVGQIKIVLLTDVHQMLAPDAESTSIEMFNEFIKQDNVIFSEVTGTKRAWDQDTIDTYDYYYNLDSDVPITVKMLTSKYPTIRYEDMEYTQNATYITHSNAIEDMLYLDKSLCTLWEDENVKLIPKGGIASQDNPKRDKHPILSQIGVKKNPKFNDRGYFQVANIATPTRMQGSEVEPGNKLYYMITEKSCISAREFYTVVTRLHYVKDLVIVICDNVEEVEPLITFKGLPVKKEIYLHVDYEFDESGTKYLSQKDMREYIQNNYPDSDTVYYNKHIIYSNEYGDKTRLIAMMDKGYEPFDPGQRRHGVTELSLIRREGTLQYSYMPEIYRILEKIGLEGINTASVLKANVSKKLHYNFDFTGAFPTFLKYCEVPIDGYISYKRSDNMINWYLYEGDFLTNHCFIKQNLADEIVRRNAGKVTYMFSTPKQTGCIAGEESYKKYHKSVEDKKEAKNELLWGALRWNYVELSEEGDCYLLREDHKYEMLMASIYSDQAYYVLKISDAVNGSYIKVDAVFVDYKPTKDDFEKALSVLPEGFELKLVDDNNDKEVIFTNSKPLPTKKELASQKRREQRANETPEQREERLRKDRERKRLAKLNKQ